MTMLTQNAIIITEAASPDLFSAMAALSETECVAALKMFVQMRSVVAGTAGAASEPSTPIAICMPVSTNPAAERIRCDICPGYYQKSTKWSHKQSKMHKDAVIAANQTLVDIYAKTETIAAENPAKAATEPAVESV